MVSVLVVVLFQSTLPHGSDSIRLGITPILTNFNPRSLTGATGIYGDDTSKASISIHAPSRERHAVPLHTLDAPRISIHAPSRERRSALYSLGQYVKISIHAPSRERPFDSCAYVARYIIFQSTLPHGSDILTLESSLLFSDFNPRSLTGATPRQGLKGCDCLYFNPRSLTGATQKFDSLPTLNPISIHAPSRERRHTAVTLYVLGFQSTLPHGSDCSLLP